jgi:hypothetical protein
MKDMHIVARITQFRDNKEGIDVHKCPVVVEYIQSGRADMVDESTEGACTFKEVLILICFPPSRSRKELLYISNIYFIGQ